jgi:phage FluMu protein Com
MNGKEREALERIARIPPRHKDTGHLDDCPVCIARAALAAREEPPGETCDHCGKLAVEPMHGEDGFTLCPVCACVLAVAHKTAREEPTALRLSDQGREELLAMGAVEMSEEDDLSDGEEMAARAAREDTEQ